MCCLDLPCVVRFIPKYSGSIDKGNFHVTYEVYIFVNGKKIPVDIQEDYNKLLFLLLNK